MSVHEVLGKYAHMWHETVLDLERVKEDRDDWRNAWFENDALRQRQIAQLEEDYAGAQNVARYWYQKYNKITDGLIEIEMSFAPSPRIVEDDGVRSWVVEMDFVSPDAVDI